LKDTFSVKKIKYASSEIEKYKRVLQEFSANTPQAAARPLLQISDAPFSVPAAAAAAAAEAAAGGSADSFFTESAKSEIMDDLDKFLSETAEEQYIDAITQTNTQYNQKNNINISFETI
jgi:hypothetical protein